MDAEHALQLVKAAMAEMYPEIATREITLETPLFAYDESVTDSLDLDSLDALEVISILERQLDVELDDEVLEEGDLKLVGDVVELLAAFEVTEIS